MQQEISLALQSVFHTALLISWLILCFAGLTTSPSPQEKTGSLKNRQVTSSISSQPMPVPVPDMSCRLHAVRLECLHLPVHLPWNGLSIISEATQSHRDLFPPKAHGVVCCQATSLRNLIPHNGFHSNVLASTRNWQIWPHTLCPISRRTSMAK